MGGVYLLAALQVGDGAGHFQHPAVGARREAKALKGQLEQSVGGLGGLAHLLQLGVGYVPVAGVAPAREALLLAFPGGADPLSNLGGALLFFGGGKLRKGHRVHLDVQVDAVQQRPGDLPHVALHRVGMAQTGMGGVPKVAAGAGVHGGNQHKPAGIGGSAAHPGDGHLAVLQGLAQHFHSGPGELRQLI